MGQWQGCRTEELKRASRNYAEYTVSAIKRGGSRYVIQSLMKDKVTLVKKDGTVLKTDIPAAVTSGQITTSSRNFHRKAEDHLLRQLPNGMVRRLRCV